MQVTTKKAKEEKAQGFGRKLDAEKIIGATNEPGLKMFRKPSKVHICMSSGLHYCFDVWSIFDPAVHNWYMWYLNFCRRTILPDQVERDRGG